MVGGDDSVQLKFECKKVDPACENIPAIHILPDNSGTVIDSEKSSINMDRKSTIGFPRSHRPRSCVTPNLPFPKMGFRYPNLSFFAEISTKNH